MTAHDYERLLATNIEIRNPKQIQMFENLMFKTNSVDIPAFHGLSQTSRFSHLNFVFCPGAPGWDFVFRISLRRDAHYCGRSFSSLVGIRWN